MDIEKKIENIGTVDGVNREVLTQTFSDAGNYGPFRRVNIRVRDEKILNIFRGMMGEDVVKDVYCSVYLDSGYEDRWEVLEKSKQNANSVYPYKFNESFENLETYSHYAYEIMSNTDGRIYIELFNGKKFSIDSRVLYNQTTGEVERGAVYFMHGDFE